MKLYYFDLYGRAEPIRILLDHAKVDYEDVRVSGPSWKELKEDTEKCKYGQIPILEKDGKFYSQSNSILRYLGGIHGYYPEDLEERFRADELIDLVGDFTTPIGKNLFGPLKGEEK